MNTVARHPYLSVIIPAYNEEHVIASHVTEVAEYLYRFLGHEKDFEIIVVDDGSTDGTKDVLQVLAAERPYLRVYNHVRQFRTGEGP